MDDFLSRRAKQGDTLMAVLRDAGIGPDSVVRVAGRDGLAPLIWLCRQGFSDVGYVRLGAGGMNEAADLLLILHNPPPEEMQALLRRHGGLKPGGVLVLQTREADGSDRVQSMLDAAGFRVERCLQRHFKVLHVARHIPQRMRQAA
jgi:hypothetical protein